MLAFDPITHSEGGLPMTSLTLFPAKPVAIPPGSGPEESTDGADAPVLPMMPSHCRHPIGCASMIEISPKLKRAVRVVVGGTWGLVAWTLSGASALAVVLWGLKAVAIPLLMVKTASWGIWGLGVLRESKARNKSTV
jgi:hypothetical protein